MKSFATVQEDLQLTFLLLVVCYKRKMDLNNFSIVHSGSIFAIKILMQGDVVNKLSLIQILETLEDVNIMESMHHILWVMDNERYHHLDEITYNVSPKSHILVHKIIDARWLRPMNVPLYKAGIYSITYIRLILYDV